MNLREEVIASMEEEVSRLKGNNGTTNATAASSYNDSQSSIGSSSEDSGSTRSSSNSQDRLSLSAESVGASIECQDDAHKSG